MLDSVRGYSVSNVCLQALGERMMVIMKENEAIMTEVRYVDNFV